MCARAQIAIKAIVYRLLAVYRRDPSTCSRPPNRGGRILVTRLLSTDVETVIQTLISGYYLKSLRPRVADLCRFANYLAYFCSHYLAHNHLRAPG
jgi:hypothetical protein